MPTADLPDPVAGATLALKIKTTGVTKVALCRRLGVARSTLDNWLKDPDGVPSLRVVRVQRALDELVDEALA